ncbi:cysteine/serine-rich nuclear protein 2-like [Anguilla anguilla]|uniref:cysteine/serine-rich nuclear protein 2-like n=1 Tax=Anguilla anguilla TaxID=7936 RepID=UPI0015AE15B8|nr:cysteine/serine-rich nuclear protein 2-like [Anguilla anguilla]XP_035242829.1 cysteine/serine-rich nuclear protein 2-like [Anguilla anguilla]
MEACSVLSLKRRFEEVDSGSPYSTPKDSDDDILSSDSVDSCDSLNPPSSTSLTPPSILRQRRPPPGRKSVRFDAVTVYYFSRRQGFNSVPSQGGSSLGMAQRHSAIRRYTLGEFAREQRTTHRQVLRQHLRQEKLKARKMKLTQNGAVECAEAETLTLEDVSDEDLDVEGVEVDDCFFLQPLPTKRRRALLRASGITRIDGGEKSELRAIRLSREECGCDCRFYCDPRRCGCSQAGIKCQVDRVSFPCGCSRDGCGNTAGRIEFNPLRVRTHYLHTIMKLDLEKKRQMGVGVCEGLEAAEAVCSITPASEAPAHFGVEIEVHSQTVPAEGADGDPDYISQGDSLALENEAAVLHLQSAEERERRREQEEEEASVGAGGLADSGLCLLPESLQGEVAGEQGAEPIVIQGPFPPGTSVLCIAEGQEGPDPQAFLKDPASLLFYHIGSVQPEPTVLPQPGEQVGGGAEEDQEEGPEGETSPENSQDSLPAVVLCSENYTETEDGPLLQEGSFQRLNGLPQENARVAFEGEVSTLPLEALGP